MFSFLAALSSWLFTFDRLVCCRVQVQRRPLGRNVQKGDFCGRFWRLSEWNWVATYWPGVTSPDLHTPAVNKSSAALPAAPFLSLANVASLRPGCKRWVHARAKHFHAPGNVKTTLVQRAAAAILRRLWLLCVLSRVSVKATLRCRYWILYSAAVWRDGASGRCSRLWTDPVMNSVAGTQRAVGSGPSR